MRIWKGGEMYRGQYPDSSIVKFWNHVLMQKMADLKLLMEHPTVLY